MNCFSRMKNIHHAKNSGVLFSCTVQSLIFDLNDLCQQNMELLSYFFPLDFQYSSSFACIHEMSVFLFYFVLSFFVLLFFCFIVNLFCVLFSSFIPFYSIFSSLSLFLFYLLLLSWFQVLCSLPKLIFHSRKCDT